MIYSLSTSLLLLTILVLVLVIRSGVRSLITMILIPFLLFNIGFSWYIVNDLWGRPKMGVPEHAVQFLNHSVAKPWIYIVVKDPDKEEPEFRKIPYTKDNEKKLSDAKAKTKNGQRVKIKEQQIDGNTAEIKLYDWNHLESMVKDQP